MTSAGLIGSTCAVLLLLAGPLGVRAGWWSPLVGLGFVAGSVLLALVAVVLLAISARHGISPLAGTALVAAIAVGAIPLWFVWAARSAPAIHDISTDLSDPPLFVRVLPLREPGSNPLVPPDERRAAAQKQAYPAVQPLDLPLTPDAAFDRALASARSLEWTIVADDRRQGRIEATATTRWFGFSDDIVIRLRPIAGGTRVDIRSASRVGVGDMGANARRIEQFLALMRQAS